MLGSEPWCVSRNSPATPLPICSSFAIPLSSCCSGLLWQGVAMRSALKLLGKAARVHGSAEMAAIRQCTSRGAARKAEMPCVAARGAPAGSVAWRGSLPSYSAPFMPITQPIRTAPLPRLPGRPRDRFIYDVACVHARPVESKT